MLQASGACKLGTVLLRHRRVQESCMHSGMLEQSAMLYLVICLKSSGGIAKAAV